MRLLLALTLAFAFGCTPAYPGEVDGTFDMVGSLEQNSCGETALPAANPLLFNLELRSDGTGQAFWRRPEMPAVSGTQIDGTYRFRFVTGLPVYAADEVAGTLGCALLQEEVVELTPQPAGDAAPDASMDAASLDAGVGVDRPGVSPDGGGPVIEALSGTDTIRLTVAPGYDCTPLLGSAGGPFLALPCEVDYALVGSPGSPF